MKKKILSLLAFSAILATSCDYNDKHFDGLDDISVPADFKGVEYTLTADDYKKIAKYPENQELVKKLDEEMEQELREKAGVDGSGKVTVLGSDGKEYEVEETPGTISFTAYRDALADLNKTPSFSPILPDNELLDPFLRDKWAFKDPKTAVKLTYNKSLEISDFDRKLNYATDFIVDSKSYESVWGDVEANYFTEANPAEKHLPEILKSNIQDSKDGDIVIANYKVSAIEPGAGTGQDNPILFSESFPEGFTVAGTEWTEELIKGERTWQWKTFDNNSYLQFSSFKSGEENLNRLITPSIRLKGTPVLTFDVNVGNYNGKALKVYVAEDNGSLEWKEITDSFTIPEPEKGYAGMANAGEYDLKAYTGKRVFVAFEYAGNGIAGAEGAVTTTIQVTNVVVTNTSASTTRTVATRAATTKVITAEASLYQYNNDKWELKKDILVLSSDDYAEMGVADDKFNTLAAGQNMVARKLTHDYPYAQDEYAKDVVFKVKNDIDYISDFVLNRFEYTANNWVFVPNQKEITSQFVRFEKNEWKYDPSVYLILAVDKGPISAAFYQSIVDWVWENIEQGELGLAEKGKGYINDSRGNNEYYFGASAFQTNMDMRLGKYQGLVVNKADGSTEKPYEEYKTNDELRDFIMYERWPRAFKIGLENKYPNVELIDGIDIFYTVNFGTYDGKNSTFEIKYKLVGTGQFEFVEGSIKQLK